jgi:hypothetical protein
MYKGPFHHKVPCVLCVTSQSMEKCRSKRSFCSKLLWGYVITWVANLTEEKSLCVQQDFRYGDLCSHRVLKIDSSDSLMTIKKYIFPCDSFFRVTILVFWSHGQKGVAVFKNKNAISAEIVRRENSEKVRGISPAPDDKFCAALRILTCTWGGSLQEAKSISPRKGKGPFTA